MCDFNPLFFLLLTHYTDLLLLFLAFLLGIEDEIFTIKLLILKIFLGFIMFSLAANQLGLKVLLFALFMDQLISKSFISHPDFVKLPLIKLIQNHVLRCWEGHDGARVRARADAPPWTIIQLIVPTHRLLSGESTASSESVLAIWLAQLVHSKHGDVRSGPRNLTIVELSVTFLLFYSLPLLNHIINSLLKRRQVVVVADLGQLSYQLVVLIFFRFLISHLSFKILQALPGYILNVDL